MDFDEEEPTQMELNPNPALRTGNCRAHQRAATDGKTGVTYPEHDR
jgi:hypothetical protein